MGAELTGVGEGAGCGEEGGIAAGRATVAVGALDEDVEPARPGGAEVVVAHDGVIVGVLVDPDDEGAGVDGQVERREAVFTRNDHPGPPGRILWLASRPGSPHHCGKDGR